MPLFRRRGDDEEARHRVALIVAAAAHVERNIPQLFPQATTDLLENAADELRGDGPVSFETATVVRRTLESVRARKPDRPWAEALAEALGDVDLDALRPPPHDH